MDHAGHDPAGPAVDQGLSEKALIKDEGAVDGGYAALVAPVLYPFPNSVVESFGDGGGAAVCRL